MGIVGLHIGLGLQSCTKRWGLWDFILASASNLAPSTKLFNHKTLKEATYLFLK